MVRVGLITTVRTNIGDDFIREGIVTVLGRVFGGRTVRAVLVNKHKPMTVYPRWHPCRWVESLPRGKGVGRRILGQALSRHGLTYFDKCDAIIQCGAPVLWPGCHECEWAEPLWYQVVGRLFEKTPVVNLAAGSCYPWERQPQEVSCERDEQYLRRVLSYCRLTTVRDSLAKVLCNSLGFEVPLLPCTAFLAGNAADNRPRLISGGTILINYMSGASHFDWGQGIDRLDWQRKLGELLRRLKKRHTVVFLCHNRTEYRLAEQLDPTLTRILPNNTKQYVELVRGASAALCNRMHACVALASLGIPSVGVGTDTRLLMLSEIGLPALYVKDVTVDELEDRLENFVRNHRAERERLVALQSQALANYIQLVANALHF